MIKAQLTGNLGADPVERPGAKGEPFVTARVAVYQGKDQESMWVSVAASGYAGKELMRAKKGEKVYLSGSLSSQDKDGKTFINLNYVDQCHRLVKFEPTEGTTATTALATTRPAKRSPEAANFDFVTE